MEFITTTDLKSQAYQDALAIRTTVFVKEQHVPEALEVDADEAKATYFLAYDSGLPIATARILPEGTGFHVQRVAVLAAYRHHGVGKQLLDAIAKYAKAHGATCLRLEAQLHALGFYETLGYQLTARPEFTDAGIRHREMTLTL